MKILYYRINTITVHSPPLRRRKEDIPLLVEYFLVKGNARFMNRGRQMAEDVDEDLHALRLARKHP